ncbi:GIY-YIG nuclease family protein, partial [Streptococcus pyogenes]
GREDGHLSKAQLDLLERLIIEKMNTANIDLDNSTQGNKSYIDKLSKFSALSLWNKVEKLLNDVANIDLFDSEHIQTEDNSDNSTLNS